MQTQHAVSVGGRMKALEGGVLSIVLLIAGIAFSFVALVVYYVLKGMHLV
jgi:hypothetical protein